MATVRKRHSDATGTTSWQVLYRLPPGSKYGKPQSGMTFTNEKAANDFRDLIRLLGSAEKALATLDAQKQEAGLTLDDLAAKFFDWKANDVEDRTIKDYRRDYRNWIAPELGQRQAEMIDEVDVQAVVDKWRTRLDPKSVTDRHAILSGIYRFGSARSRRLVSHNPCLETQLPKRRKKRPKGFTRPQWAAMHEWGRQHEPDADDLLLFIAATGWRFSEVTPLTPAAIEDFGDAEVDGERIPIVFATVLGVHRRNEEDQTIYVEGDAKTDDSLRRINLPPSAAAMVRRRFVGKGSGDLLFTSPTGKQWRSNNFLEREFQRILDGAGIEKVKGMGPHYLRHLHVAVLDHAEVSPAKTQRRIGHANITTTFGVYGGMIGNTLSPRELLAIDRQIAAEEPVGGQVVAGSIVASAAELEA